MSESRLRNISDDNTLSCEKRRVAFAMVLAGLIMGTVYLTARSCCLTNDMVASEGPASNVPRVQ